MNPCSAAPSPSSAKEVIVGGVLGRGGNWDDCWMRKRALEWSWSQEWRWAVSREMPGAFAGEGGGNITSLLSSVRGRNTLTVTLHGSLFALRIRLPHLLPLRRRPRLLHQPRWLNRPKRRNPCPPAPGQGNPRKSNKGPHVIRHPCLLRPPPSSQRSTSESHRTPPPK